ncbi:MAG: type II toxin-antitoxin system HicB family antitoxin [Phycisphaerales bacterium]
MAKARRTTRRDIKIIVEKHPDGYVAYPLGMRGVVVGQGDSYQDALDDVRSAIKFHIATFGAKSVLARDSAQEAFVAELRVA